MKFEIIKLTPNQRKKRFCLYCHRKPRYSIFPLEQNEKVEPLFGVNTCERHLGRHMRLLWPLFKFENHILAEMMECVKLVNTRIRAKSLKIHPKDPRGYQ